MKIDKTTSIIKMTIPGYSTSDYGAVTLISTSKPPWEDGVSIEDAVKKARDMGAYLGTIGGAAALSSKERK